MIETHHIKTLDTSTSTTTFTKPISVSISSHSDEQEELTDDDGDDDDGEDDDDGKKTKGRDDSYTAKAMATVASACICGLVEILTNGQSGIGWFIFSLLCIW